MPRFGHLTILPETTPPLEADSSVYSTPGSAELFPDPEMGAPYPGARDHHVVSDDRLHDAAWLQDVIARTAEQLPAPKKKTAKAKRA